MKRVIITGPLKYRTQVIKELYTQRALHIIEHKDVSKVDIGDPHTSAEQISQSLVKVRALKSLFGLNGNHTGSKTHTLGAHWQGELSEIQETARKLEEELQQIETDFALLDAEKRELLLLKNFPITLDVLSTYQSIDHMFGTLNKSGLQKVQKKLSSKTDRYSITAVDTGSDILVLLFIEKSHAPFLHDLLKPTGFQPIQFKALHFEPITPLERISQIKDREIALHSQKKLLAQQLQNLGKLKGDFLIVLETKLDEEMKKAELPLKIAETKNTFIISGWIPAEKDLLIERRMSEVTVGKAHLRIMEPDHSDKVPVKLENPKATNSFEFFLDLYAMPNYTELDPTFFIFLMFPLFFGFMLGDIGYGLVAFIIFFMLKRFMASARKFANVLMLSSISSIFFGALFGEFFGFEEIAGRELPHLLSRAHQINELLYISVAIGVIHVNLGYILGFWNELKEHGFFTAVCAKGGWIVVEGGIVITALSFYHVLLLQLWVGILIACVGMIMLLKGEGMRGIIELPGLFSNVLSYARLMAIGLSSVILAVIINEQSELMIHKGGIFVVIGILILLIGHTINIVLGIVGAFLHSLRLQYVEFFSKFFHGGAPKYVPFGKTE